MQRAHHQPIDKIEFNNTLNTSLHAINNALTLAFGYLEKDFNDFTEKNKEKVLIALNEILQNTKQLQKLREINNESINERC